MVSKILQDHILKLMYSQANHVKCLLSFSRRCRQPDSIFQFFTSYSILSRPTTDYFLVVLVMHVVGYTNRSHTPTTFVASHPSYLCVFAVILLRRHIIQHPFHNLYSAPLKPYWGLSPISCLPSHILSINLPPTNSHASNHFFIPLPRAWSWCVLQN